MLARIGVALVYFRLTISTFISSGAVAGIPSNTAVIILLLLTIIIFTLPNDDTAPNVRLAINSLH